MWIIDTDQTMAIEEVFVWIGNIYSYQCDLFPFKYNTMASNLYEINLSYLLLNGCIPRISIFTSQYLLPIDSNTLASNFDEINPTFVF